MVKKAAVFLFAVFALLIIGSFLYTPAKRAPEVLADIGDNVEGWAWSAEDLDGSGDFDPNLDGGFGWISFNCKTDTTISCSDSNYGVNIDTSAGPNRGKMSGYAWGGKDTDEGGLGWISFNAADTAGCPSAPCQARVVLPADSTGRADLEGWARALSGKNDTTDGWEGWIRLSGGWSDTAKLNLITKRFEGYAWGGEDSDADGTADSGPGWIDLNPLSHGFGSNAEVIFTGTFGGPPNAVNDSAATNKNTPVQIDVLANDSDPDGDPLDITSATAPSHGSASIVGAFPNEEILYTPNTSYVGSDSFTYEIHDGNGNLDTATVYVDIYDCGNGIIETGEICDPGPPENLNGESCQTQGFIGGDLNCAPDCQAFDTGACVGAGDVDIKEI